MKRPLVAIALVCATLSRAQQAPPSAAVIEHVVVIFQENVSFDHYFATYPHAPNPPGEPAFTALPGTPEVDGLKGALLTANPNGVNPRRLDRAHAATPDQDHSYTQEQLAYNHGKMDRFPSTVDRNGDNLAYFDGNTVTAIWNYAQRFAMNERFFQSTFGPSVLGALNLVSGQTNGIVAVKNGTSPNVIVDGGSGSFTVVGDADPVRDVCSAPKRIQISMGGRNVGDLLNDAHLTWGWFEEGFDLTVKNPNGTTGCSRAHTSEITKVAQKDYVAHHEPFQYYASTANALHARPASIAGIGRSGDAANHQYDLTDFFAAADAGHFPAVSFLKPAGYQNGHAGYSDPLDEQEFLVRVINDLQQRPEWRTTAIFLTWDDSDGWYDHLMGPIVNSSVGLGDQLNADGLCGDGVSILPGIRKSTPHALGRCGYGPRLPLLVISPWARQNYVDRSVTDLSSVLRFIEDTFLDGRRIGGGSFDAIGGGLDPLFDFGKPPNVTPLLLDPKTGRISNMKNEE